jgi:hypothetical protein
MSHLRAILSAGVCSVALSGCLPAAAGLALSAVSMVTGGGGKNGGDGFRNPIDRQATERQVRQALSQLNDKVDPACQAMLEQRMQTYGTLAVGAGRKPGAAKPAQSTADSPSDAKTKTPPVNLLAKVSVPADEAAPAAPAPDVAVSTDLASGTAPADTKPEGATPPAPENAVAASPGEGASADTPAGLQPVKASLEPDAASGPGQCEHRWVCLPSTPKPTIMLMCPGKGGKKPDTTTAAAGASTAPDDAAAEKPAKNEQETAALGADKSEAAAPPAPGTVPASTPAEAPAEVPAEAPAASAKTEPTAAAEPAHRTLRSGGVADWNWSYDPSKRL